MRSLRICVAALLGFSAPSVFAGTVFVTNCSNTGTGSLRSAVSAANSGDTVDMSALTPSSTACAASTITLTTGAIAVAQSNLTIVGPGKTDLAVSGDYKGRVFDHTGTGTLALQDFSIENGSVKESGTAYGGCLYSNGSVNLLSVNVSACKAYSTGKSAFGGGIFAKKKVTLKYSTVSDSRAITSAEQSFASGGGVLSDGGLSLKFSEVSENSATTDPTYNLGVGGGISNYGSTVS